MAECRQGPGRVHDASGDLRAYGASGLARWRGPHQSEKRVAGRLGRGLSLILVIFVRWGPLHLMAGRPRLIMLALCLPLLELPQQAVPRGQ